GLGRVVAIRRRGLLGRCAYIHNAQSAFGPGNGAAGRRPEPKSPSRGQHREYCLYGRYAPTAGNSEPLYVTKEPASGAYMGHYLLYVPHTFPGPVFIHRRFAASLPLRPIFLCPYAISILRSSPPCG